MRTNFYCTDKMQQNTTLGVWSIYRILADQTYRVRHASEEKGRQVFVYTDLGQGILQCAEGEFVLKARTGLVFSADTPFSYWTAESTWHFWWFEFDGEGACEKGVLYTLGEEQWMGMLGERALERLRLGEASSAVYLSCMLAIMKETSCEKNREQDVFSQAQVLIREKLYRNSVDSMAAELCVDPRTLYNIFQTCAGCSPKVYLRNYVLDLSQFLLANTTKSIGEIAEDMGFSDQFHFSRVFRENVGVAPREYRKQKGKI